MVRKHDYASQQRGGVRPMAARIRNEGGVTRIDVFDDIGEGFFGGGVSAKSFAEQLAGVRGPVELHVSSGGGDVFDGLAMYSALRQHPGPVTAVVDGLAASIASVIVQAAGERVMTPGSFLMVHDAWKASDGNADELRRDADLLDKVSANLASVYAERCGGTAAQWRDVMRTETWYTADEAVAAGLADRVGGAAAVAPAGLDLAAYSPPGRIAAALRAMPRAPAAGRGRLQSVTAAPGQPAAAQLDRFPFARDWQSFLAAVRDKDDRAGLRRETARIRNAGMSERVPSEGGFLVPWQLQQKVLALMTTAIVRPNATYIPMTTLRTGVPFLENADQSTAGQALAGLNFSLIESGATFPATNAQFGRTTLEVSKVGAYMTGVPNELLADSPAFTDVFLPVTIARGLAFYEDALFLASGNGVGQPQALLNAEASLTVDRATSDAVVLADLVAMVKGLHAESMKSATWLVSKSANDQILDLYYAAQGQVWNGSELVSAQMPVSPPEWYRPGTADGPPCMLGFPVEVHDHGPALGDRGDVMLCDLSLYLVADHGEMTVEISSKGSGFVNDTSNIRIRHRVDGRFWPQSAYTTSTGQTVSPLVVLQ